jgi:hypothetical protein
MLRARNLVAGIGLSGSLAAVALVTPMAVAVGPGPSPAAVAGRAVVSGAHAPSAAVGGDRMATVAPLAAGQRMTVSQPGASSARVLNRLRSTNWSGAIERTTLGATKGAAAEWTVPTVWRQSKTPEYSSTWVGVDGAFSLDLIQTGTNEDTRAAYGAPYAAWIEILPAPEVIIRQRSGAPARVRPGDKMTAIVALVRAGEWVVYLRDATEHWYFEKEFAFHGAGTSAEWIQEAPTVNGHQSSIADFGNVHFRETSIYGDGPKSKGWYSTVMGEANEILLYKDNNIKAAPSVPLPARGSAEGQRFSDHYR